MAVIFKVKNTFLELEEVETPEAPGRRRSSSVPRGFKPTGGNNRVSPARTIAVKKVPEKEEITEVILQEAKRIHWENFKERLRQESVQKFWKKHAAFQEAYAVHFQLAQTGRFHDFIKDSDEAEGPGNDNDFDDFDAGDMEEATECEVMKDPLPEEESFTNLVKDFRGDCFERDMAQSLGYASLALAIAERQANEHQALRCKMQSRDMIFVRTISRTIVVRVWKNATVEEVKALLDQNTNFITRGCILQHAGRRLEDTCELSSYGNQLDLA